MFDPVAESRSVRITKAIRTAWWAVIGWQHRTNARRNRERYVRRLIGVTGSVGKTTATHLLIRLLSVYGKSGGAVDDNTEYRILRTLRYLREPTDFMVEEISGHKPGHIRSVAAALRFDGAIITAVGTDHGTQYGGIAGVAREKSELVKAIGPEGFVCLNADDPNVSAMAAVAGCRVLTYGTAPGAMIRAVDVRASWPDRLRFTLEVEGKRYEVATQLLSSVFVTSILAAFCAVHALGLELAPAIAAAGDVKPFRDRLEPHPGPHGHTYLVDTFKASMWSTDVLLDRLPELGVENLVVVLGEISDIKSDAPRNYRRMLRKASRYASYVVGLGPAGSAARKLAELGTANARGFDRLEEISAFLASLPPSLVVLKTNGRVDFRPIYEGAATPPA